MAVLAEKLSLSIRQIWPLHGVKSHAYACPLFCDGISAGFPNQATEEVEDTLDLNSLLIKHPAATFFIRVSGSSMTKAGIYHNDILIVDRSFRRPMGKWSSPLSTEN